MPVFIWTYCICSTHLIVQCFYLVFPKQDKKPHLIFKCHFSSPASQASCSRTQNGSCELTLFTKSTHPAFRTGAGVGPLAHAPILALQPAHGWEGRNRSEHFRDVFMSYMSDLFPESQDIKTGLFWGWKSHACNAKGVSRLLQIILFLHFYPVEPFLYICTQKHETRTNFPFALFVLHRTRLRFWFWNKAFHVSSK